MNKRARLKSQKRVGNYFLQQSGAVFISSGCTVLDCCLGGGWPLGRIVNVVGDKSSGKTLLAIEACANFVKVYPKGHAYYLEAEAAFDKRFAAALGMPVNDIEFIDDVQTVEGLFDELDNASRSSKKQPGLFIVDSLDALSDTAEMDRDMDKGSYGAEKAKKMSQLFRRLSKQIEQSQLLVMIISQVRDRIGVAFGDRHSRSGGKALDFYAAQILYLSEIGKERKTIRGVQRPIAVNVKAMVKKNKVGLPFRQCEFRIVFGYGVDSIASGLNFLASVGELQKIAGGLSKNNISKYMAKISKLPDTEYGKRAERIARIVKEVWQEIESQFLPKRRKY